MDPVVVAAGTALVGAMATDAWQHARAGVWRLRMQQLVCANPELAPELRRLLDETLTPHLTPEERERVTSIELRATARGRGRVYQAGRDQHITER